MSKFKLTDYCCSSLYMLDRSTHAEKIVILAASSTLFLYDIINFSLYHSHVRYNRGIHDHQGNGV